jgi:hypothetical protein
VRVMKILSRLLLAAIVLSIGACETQTSSSSRTETRGTIPSEKEAIYDSINAGSIKIAQALLADDWDIAPRTPIVHLSAPLSWTEDPFKGRPSGGRTPDDRPWKIAFYSLRPLGHLLYAYYTTRDRAYRDKLVELLHGFADADSVRAPNPDTFDFGQTPALRTMMLVNAYGKLKRSGDLDAELAEKLEGALERSAEELLNPYNFDVDGTHAITEASALLILAENFPALPLAKMCAQVASDRLMATLTKSIDGDGVDVRGNPGHHFYVLSAVLAIHHWADRYGVALPSGFGDRVHAMLRYATHIPQPDSALPLLDATGRFDVRDLNPTIYDELDNLADSPAPPDDATATTTTTSSLTLTADFGFSFVRTRGKSGEPPTERNVVFAESGQGVLRSSFGREQTFLDQTYVTFNTAAGTAHHDALALTLFGAGELLFTDSGQGEDPYFTSTRAHNTIVIDSKNQSEGSATTTRGLIKTGDAWAYQSGTSRSPDVEHRRAVLLLTRDVVIVADRVKAATDSQHTYAQTWHLAPNLTMAVNGSDVIGKRPADGTPIVRLQQQAVANLETKRDGQVAFSKYEAPKSAWTAEYIAKGRSATFTTLITSGRYAPQPSRFDVKEEATEEKLTIKVCLDSESFEATLTHVATTNESIEVVSRPCE